MYHLIYNIVTFNRTNIATESIGKLMLQQVQYSLVHCIDDCSSEDKNDLSQIFDQPNIFDTHRKLTVNKINLGVEDNNICRLNDEVYNDQEFVYLTDDDVCYSKLFYLELQKLIFLMKENKDVFAASLFNFNTEKSCHPELKQFNDNYVYKQSIGGVSVLIRVNDFKQAMGFYQSKEYNYIKGWDWALCYFANLQNKSLISTKNSYVQHIGEVGVNSTSERFDYATNFIKQ